MLHGWHRDDPLVDPTDVVFDLSAEDLLCIEDVVKYYYLLTGTGAEVYISQASQICSPKTAFFTQKHCFRTI